jgi:hypothetical protein
MQRSLLKKTDAGYMVITMTRVSMAALAKGLIRASCPV